MVVAPDGDEVQLQDLRGIECYAQPDLLSVCGLGDTIPILLFTKSEDPIFDVTLTVNFEDGLEYGRFAFVDSGPADLDSVNIENPEAPVFRISELSQAGGAVVVYVGVRASCGLDLAINNPGITFSAQYTAGGLACTSTLAPETPYGANISIPEVVFNGGPNPRFVDLTDRGVERCTTIPISQVTQGTGAFGAIVTIDDYGFLAGNSVTAISVDGVPVPVGDVTTDPVSGVVTVILDGETNTSYFGGDGLLEFSENSNLSICFAGQDCFGDVTPDLSVIFACMRELCVGSPVTNNGLTLRNRFDFNVDWMISNVTVLQTPSACDPALGTPSPFLVSYDIASASGDFRGDLRNVQLSLERCATLSVDTIYYTLNGGTQTFPLPTGAFTQNLTDPLSPDFGVTSIDLNNGTVASFIPSDPDLPGVGIEDLDGDGRFDDIAGDQTLTIFMGFTPEAGEGLLSCGGGIDGDGICDFTTVGLQGVRDCGRETVTYTAPIPGTNSVTFSSTAGIGGDTTSFNVGSRMLTGAFNFGVVGITTGNPTPPNISSSLDVEFDYDLDPTETLTCGTVASRRVRVQFNAILASVGTNMELSSPAATSGAVTLLSEEISPTGQLHTWDLEVDPTVDLNTLSFVMTLDTNVCVINTSGDLSIFLLDFCDGCTDAPTSRACATSVMFVEPDDFPNCGCLYETFLTLDRVSRGFTDRDLATTIGAPADRGLVMGPTSSFTDLDTLQVLPGDTVAITSKVVVSDPSAFSNLAFIVFELTQVGDRSNFNHFTDSRNAFLTDFTFQRPGEAEIDLGAVETGPDVRDNIRVGSGNGAEATDNTVVPQPGLSYESYQVRRGGSLTGRDRFEDGNSFRLQIQDPSNGSSAPYSALLAAVGGAWQAGDTVTIRWEIPIIPIPDLVFPEGAGGASENISGQQLLDVSRFNMAIEGRRRAANGGFGGNVIGASSLCVRRPAMQFYEPRPKVDAVIDYQTTADGCEAAITIDYTIENDPPPGFYPAEYRPIIGLENFTAVIPSSFYVKKGEARIEVLNGGLSTTSFLTGGTVDTVIGGTDTLLVADPAPAVLSFADGEFTDGTNWPDYLTINGDEIDITTVGADLPLLGVGLGGRDTLRFTIPLERICPVTPAGALSVSASLANSYLADYNTRVYECDNALWSTAPCSGRTKYFPFDRDSPLHPGRFIFDETYVELNPPLPISPATATIANDFLVDTEGVTETNTYTLTSPDAVAGGLLGIEVSNAVDLQMITGDATTFTEVGTTDTSTVYRVDIGALPAGGTFSIDLITDLVFCGRAFVRISPILGCSSDDQALAAVLSSANCGGRLSYAYISGQARVVTTFDYASNQDGCQTQRYNIQYRNAGSSDLEVLNPTIFIPEGLAVDAASWTAETFNPGVGPTPIIAPTENTDRTGVYGQAFEWPANYFDGIAGTDVMTEGEIIIISFEATPTCDFTSGLPITAQLTGSAACVRTLETTPSIGPAINTVAVPDPTAPAFEFDVSENRISCSDGADPVTLTIVNVSKVPVGEEALNLCFTLPPGISVEASGVEAIAPVDYQPMITAPVPVGTGGATEICLTGPEEAIEPGGFLCLNITPQVGDIDCGPIDIGFRLTRTANINCAGVTCDIDVLAAEAFIPLEIVPGVAIIEGTLEAVCSAAPGNVDLDVEVTFENIGGPFNGNATLELYFDIDESGEVEDDDPLIDTYVEAISIGTNATGMISNVFTVPESQACPVIVKVIIPGCACGEVFLPFNPVEPDFIADLGDSYVICPGDSLIIDGLCNNFGLALSPPEAGIAVQSNDSIIVALNDGFGVLEPVTLTATNTFGICGSQMFELKVSQLETFDFGPYVVDACTEGCQVVDLGIPVALQEDLEVSISPTTFITNPGSFEPEICNPTANTVYTIDYSLNGECMASTTLRVNVVQQSTATLREATACTTGFSVNDIITLVPADQTGRIISNGDGTFTPTTVPPSPNPDFQFPEAFLSDNATYVPGPEDIAAGEVILTVRTEKPDGPCGGAVGRETFTVLLVDCGSFFWDGARE